MSALLAAWRASGREVAVVGFGKSGVAAARLLRLNGIAVYASDSGTSEKTLAQAEQLRALGADADAGSHDFPRISRAVAVVTAPGVPPDVPALAVPRGAGVPIIAEVDLGITALPTRTRVIGITGTNGKTTTTALLAHVLASAGLNALAAGNIGTALCDVVADEAAPDWLVLELSSFQLHDCPHLRPWIGVLTNLSPNHLDRYTALADYYADKALLFANADAESITIGNADQPEVEALLAPVPGRQLRFSTSTRADGWYDASTRQLMLGDAVLCQRDQLPLLGDHNIQNALVVALAAREAGLSTAQIAAGLATFKAIPHRVEPVRAVDDVLWINDSKSTNVASTAVAIAAMDRPFVLLLGGRHKGEPYTGLGPLLEARCLGVIAYGESAPLVMEDLGRFVGVTRAGNFDEVLATARAMAKPGSAVLLSPACSSYDMFDNYEQRGDTFRRIVESM